MDEDDITILDSVLSITGQTGRVYYYQGNIYQPLFLHGSDVARVKRAVRQFMKEHADRVATDRAHPDYKTLLEIFDEQVSA